MCDLLGVEPERLVVMAADLQVLRVVTADAIEVFTSIHIADVGQLLPGPSEVLCELADGVEDPVDLADVASRVRCWPCDVAAAARRRDGDSKPSSRPCGVG